MYIQKSDYKGRISTALLDIIVSEDETAILTEASKTAEDTLKSTAGVLYNIDDEFTKTGTNRNGFILSMALSIALYNLYQITDDYEVPQKVIKNYDDTMHDLTKIANGKMNLNLPANTGSGSGSGTDNGDPEQASTSGIGLRRIGSAKKRSHRV